MFWLRNKKNSSFININHFSITPSYLEIKDKVDGAHMSPFVGFLFVCLFCCFTSQVNSYGHCGTVSSPNHTFFLGKLEQAVNQ